MDPTLLFPIYTRRILKRGERYEAVGPLWGSIAEAETDGQLLCRPRRCVADRPSHGRAY